MHELHSYSVIVIYYMSVACCQLTQPVARYSEQY